MANLNADLAKHEFYDAINVQRYVNIKRKLTKNESEQDFSKSNNSHLGVQYIIKLENTMMTHRVFK